jgi:hypothetical protein
MAKESRWLALMLLGAAINSQALQVIRTSSTNLYVDFSSDMRCSYVSYMVTNTDGVTHSNLWVTIGSFTNPAVRLGGGDPGQYSLGALANNQGKPVFFYLQATNQAASSQLTVKVYNGYPAGGTLLTSSNFVLTALTSAPNQQNSVTSVTYTPANSAALGAVVKMAVRGTTGNVAVGNDLAFSPATFTNWNAWAFELLACSITITNSPNVVLTNTLNTTSTIHITGNGDPYEADYWLRAVAVTSSNTPVSPLLYVNDGGGSVNHVQESTLLALLPLTPPTNQTVMTPLVGFLQLYTNELAALTLQFSNASSADVTLDRVVDTLPPGFNYVANSTKYNAAAFLDPSVSGLVLTWSQPFVVPAGTSQSFAFQAVPTVAGYGTNSAVSYFKNTQIDTTYNTADNAPALETIRALIQPTAVNDTATTLEDTALVVSAPGVLTNDLEPNGFVLSVLSYTQPAHGAATVSANGAYTYIPAANYNGTDSFTYTVTNGNARASTATVNLTVVAVNDPPSFTKGADQAVLEDAGPQVVANWATAISAGPPDESSQVLTFHTSNNNSNLFVVQPAISATGTLTYTPATNANGNATVTVVLQDNGGTANSGNDISPPQTFTITVNPVNDPPSFTKGSDQSLLEDAGAQVVANWATAISAGPPDESGQVLTFHTSNNNSNLFLAQPAISATGTLTYTPATNANGSATVTVVLQDNGGTANGGNDTSPAQTFTITVTPVNDPPSFTKGANQTVSEDAAPQVVSNWATAISAGPPDESGQAVTFHTSNNSSNLFSAQPALSAAGTLTYTPATNAYGTATVTVVLQDSGGTANGGNDTSPAQTFTVTVNKLTTIWPTNGYLLVHVTDATGAPGVGYDRLSLIGDLDIQATSVNPFTIQLASIASGMPGPAANFDKDSAVTWTIATTTRGVAGFAADKFVFDTSQFTNDLAGGVFSAALSADGLSVNLVFTPNHTPVANPVNIGRGYGTFLRFPLQTILTDYTSDADGDARALVMLGSSTNGSFVATNAGLLVYAPTNNRPESLTYVVRDVRPYRAWDAVRMATNWFTVTVTNAVGLAQYISANGTNVSVRFAGVPGYAYDVQRTTDLTSGSWLVVWTTNAPPGGVWLYLDNAPPPGGAFYRSSQH